MKLSKKDFYEYVSVFKPTFFIIYIKYNINLFEINTFTVTVNNDTSNGKKYLCKRYILYVDTINNKINHYTNEEYYNYNLFVEYLNQYRDNIIYYDIMSTYNILKKFNIYSNDKMIKQYIKDDINKIIKYSFLTNEAKVVFSLLLNYIYITSNYIKINYINYNYINTGTSNGDVNVNGNRDDVDELFKLITNNYTNIEFDIKGNIIKGNKVYEEMNQQYIDYLTKVYYFIDTL